MQVANPLTAADDSLELVLIHISIVYLCRGECHPDPTGSTSGL